MNFWNFEKQSIDARGSGWSLGARGDGGCRARALAAPEDALVVGDVAIKNQVDLHISEYNAGTTFSVHLKCEHPESGYLDDAYWSFRDGQWGSLNDVPLGAQGTDADNEVIFTIIYRAQADDPLDPTLYGDLAFTKIFDTSSEEINGEATAKFELRCIHEELSFDKVWTGGWELYDGDTGTARAIPSGAICHLGEDLEQLAQDSGETWANPTFTSDQVEFEESGTGVYFEFPFAERPVVHFDVVNSFVTEEDSATDEPGDGEEPGDGDGATDGSEGDDGTEVTDDTDGEEDTDNDDETDQEETTATKDPKVTKKEPAKTGASVGPLLWIGGGFLALGVAFMALKFFRRTN